MNSEDKARTSLSFARIDEDIFDMTTTGMNNRTHLPPT